MASFPFGVALGTMAAFKLVPNQKNGLKLVHENFSFTKKKTYHPDVAAGKAGKIQWECSNKKRWDCDSLLTTDYEVTRISAFQGTRIGRCQQILPRLLSFAPP